MNPRTFTYGGKADRSLALWVKLARANALMVKLTCRDINRYGLTQPQFAVIESLGHLGPMKISVLGAKMLVTGGNMTVVVDNLERAGLVERARCPEDRRAIRVRLTGKGDAMFREIFPLHAEYVTEALTVLTDKEIADLSKLLKKLGIGLQEKFPERPR